jgi:S1-C subfamily serine protease
MNQTLEGLGTAVSGLAEQVAANVVRLGSWRGASGVVIGDRQVLTNAHNVGEGDVEVTFADGRTATGTVAGIDEDGDLAVISVDTAGATALEWAPDGSVRTGAVVLAVAASGSGSRVTLGLVSGTTRAFRGPRGRKIRGSIEHTAPMAPGSSGSALVDAGGRLVGLNTNRVGGGFYLAIPTDAALRARLDSLARGETPKRARLGVGLAPSWAALRMRQAVGLPQRDGVLVRDVDPEGPAADAGIEVGDLIVSAAGRALTSIDDLADTLAGLGAETSIELSVVRGVEERTVRAELAKG